MHTAPTIDREHFARGYREGERDVVAGMPRALVVEEGDEPPVVKSEDSAYYHGYKAAVEGAARDEEGAWAAYVAKHAMHANPVHLKLDGNFSFGIGTEDDKAMRSNASYESGWGGPGNYGLTDGEISAAAARIARSEELFGRWQAAVESERMATAGEIIADACGAPVSNVDAPAMAEIAREIARIRSGGMRSNVRRRAPKGRPAAGSVVEVLGVLYRGIEPIPVRLGISVAPGAPDLRFTSMVESNRARETRVRVHAALVQSGADMDGVVTVDVLAGARDDAAGASGLDLPIAIGVLVAQGRIPAASLAGVMVLGELALDGRLHAVRGAAVAATGASALGARLLIVPDGNEIEARFSGSVPVVSFQTLSQVVEFMQRPQVPSEPPIQFAPCPGRDVPGTGTLSAEAVDAARRGQNLLLVGPPGAGKTMGARYIHSVLPPLTREGAEDLTLIYSAAGLISDQFVCARPFRAPHHSVSDAGLIGGGPQIRPGEVTLAHNGVLFLDELPEFRRSGIEAVATALRNGVVRFRDGGLPAAPFVVIASANPCPCGYAGTSRSCRCSEDARRRYDERLAEMAAKLQMERVEIGTLTVATMTSNSEANWERVAPGDLVLHYRAPTGTWYVTVGATPNTVSAGHTEIVDAIEWAARARGSAMHAGVFYLETPDGELVQIGTLSGHRFVPGGTDTMESVAEFVENTMFNTQYEANMRGGGKVIESRRWKNKRTGATASPYGAVPWSGAPGDTEADWTLETVGWTIQWDDGTVGTGQMPDRTPAEAQARLDRIMALRPGHRPNARKNISDVIEAFRARRPHREATCSTDGHTLYSYGLPIASYNRGEVEVLDVAESPSRTTSGQIRAVQQAFPGARTVDSVMHESAYGAAGKHMANARRGQFKAPAGLTDAEAFFYEHAGYSYPQGASAAERKRARLEHARALARAEEAAESRGWQVEWEYDLTPDTSWMTKEDLEDLERGATELLAALLRDESGEVLTSLGGVHVRAPAREDPYVRVVAAEMAQEALSAEDSASRAMALNGTRRRAEPNWRMMLDLPGVERRLGAPLVAEILAMENPGGYASSRAAGWWDANDPEMFEAYKSLARMIEDGELDDLIAETRKTH